jgi:hypothetical protein
MDTETDDSLSLILQLLVITMLRFQNKNLIRNAAALQPTAPFLNNVSGSDDTSPRFRRYLLGQTNGTIRFQELLAFTPETVSWF